MTVIFLDALAFRNAPALGIAFLVVAVVFSVSIFLMAIGFIIQMVEKKKSRAAIKKEEDKNDFS